MDKNNKTNQKNVNEPEIVEFDDFNLKICVLRGILSYGFERPSPIQKKSILPMINGKDIIAQSQSGTGKTGAFVISILQKVDEEIGGCQAIIVSHTRELARQSTKVCENLGTYTKIEIVSCIGGTNIQESRQKLSSNCASIVVGTPGRIVDMIKRKYLHTNYVHVLVLDEADELLQRNFQEQIKDIITSLSKQTQICLFSATMPKEIIDLTEQFMSDPVKILIKREKLTLEGIKQYYVNVKKNYWKFPTICDLYKYISINQSIIYVNTIGSVSWLKEKLIEKNFTVSTIHGKMTSDERIKVMSDFKNGKSRVLISTDLLARGIDVHNVAMVINYDLPRDIECYLHRIGRSGRYGKKGISISFITENDYHMLRNIETFYATKIDPMPKPDTIIF